MLYAIRASDNLAVAAHETSREEGPFFCGDETCGEEVRHCVGPYVSAYFRHLPGSDCQWGTSVESAQHSCCKIAFYNAIKNRPYVKAELEKTTFKVVKPDVYFFHSRFKKKVAIEVQRSFISDRELRRKAKAYSERKIYVLWVWLVDTWDDAKVNPPFWVKWLHNLYGGKVHVSIPSGKILAVHYEDGWTPVSNGKFLDLIDDFRTWPKGWENDFYGTKVPEALIYGCPGTWWEED